MKNEDNLIYFEEYLEKAIEALENIEESNIDLLTDTVDNEESKVLKLEYTEPLAQVVGMDTVQSPVMGCWDCGEDGIHC